MTEEFLFSIQSLIAEWFSYIRGTFGWKNIFEIFIIVAILIVFYQRFIKNTHSEKFVRHDYGTQNETKYFNGGG